MGIATKNRPIRFRTGVLCETGIFAANVLTLALPLVMVQLFDRVIPNSSGHTLGVLAFVLMSAITLEAILRGAVNNLLAVSGERYEVAAQDQLVDHILNAPAEHVQRDNGSRQLEALETIERVRSLHVGENKHTWFDIPFSMLFLLLFWYVAPALVFAMVSILAVALAGSAITRRKTKKLAETRRDQSRRGLSLSMEILGGIEHLKGMRAEPYMLRRLESLLANTARTTEELVLLQSKGKVLTEVAAQATPFIIAVFGAMAAIEGSITTGALAAAILLSGRIVQPFLRHQNVSEQRRLLAPAVKSLDAMLARTGDTGDTRPLGSFASVEMRGVGFTGDNGKPVLDGVNLSLAQGEIVAITGDSGSGKSLLLRLLSGQLIPSYGTIEVNDMPMSEIDQGDYRRAIGFMSQSQRIPSGTALDTITSFQGQAQLPVAMPIVEELGLARFFDEHPKGLMVNVGAVGRGVPAAVEGRLPLVATLARDPQLLLFDEANAALDMESDQLLLSALQRRSGRMTMVIVTQRPSYAALADRRYALENGRLVEIDQAEFFSRITGEKAA